MIEQLEPRQPDRRLSVAPMMERTDRHCRYFLRLLSRRTMLYSEMITTSAVLRGDRERLLGFDAAEHPSGLQLGGSDPEALAECTRLAEAFGYDEVNLNLGCPSARVQAARIGVCLMADPDLVARCIRAMIAATRLPVTVKTRIGIDKSDSYEALAAFVRRLADAGCRSFTIHARKAWLRGLNPQQNRELPPLDYARVHRLKAENPGLEIVINGGIVNLAEAEAQLRVVDGAMIGRAAYADPYLLADADRRLFGDDRRAPTRAEIVHGMLVYARRMTSEGVPLHALTRHMLGLFQGVPGGKAWRRHLSENAHLAGAGPGIIEEAWELAAAAALRVELVLEKRAAPGLPSAA
jgi:tRNA-dihydrouridine synthase A